MELLSLRTTLTALLVLVVAAATHPQPGWAESDSTMEPEVKVESPEVLARPVLSDEAEAFLKEFDAKRKTLLDYRASFSQTIKSSLFGDESISSGKVIYRKPKHALWTYEKPDALAFLVKDNLLSVYTANVDQVDIYDIGSQKEYEALFVGLMLPADKLAKYYEITLLPNDDKKRIGVMLKPRTPEIAQYVKEITMWLRKKDFALERTAMTNLNDDVTTIIFTKVKINSDVKDKDFELTYPAGTDIVDHTKPDSAPAGFILDKTY